MRRYVAVFVMSLAFAAAAASPPRGSGLRLRGGASRRVTHPELDSRLLRRLTFGWLNPLIDAGAERSQLTDDDLIELREVDRSEHVHELFDRAYVETSGPSDAERPALHIFRTLARAFGRPFALTGVLKLVNDCLQFAGPQLLRMTVKLVQSPERNVFAGGRLVLLLFLSSAMQAILLRHYFFQNFRTGMRINSAIMAAVYAKTLRLSSGYLSNASTGQLANLLTSDAQRISDLLGYLHALWFAPFQILVALAFLWREIGISTLAGLVTIVLCLAGNSAIARVTYALNKKLVETADERLRLTAEVFGNMKLVKMNVWEEPFAARLRAVRAREVAQMRTLAALRALLNTLFTATPTLVAAAMLTCHCALGFRLDVPAALTVLALVNMLRTPMLFLPIVSNNVIEASFAARRIARHLRAPEHAPLSAGELTAPGVRLRGAHFQWPEAEEEPAAGGKTGASPTAAAADAAADAPGGRETFALRALDLELGSKQFAAVVGAVGAGKSALLAALLGELTLTRGVAALRGRIAICPQQPFIARGTVRDNIVFGAPFDRARFDAVMAACALDVDARSWPDGAETEIGDRGATLSGGQRARIALARAVYADADVYLLDDPLSAVDSTVARHLTTHVLGPTGMLKGKLRIVATNELGAVGKADVVFGMDDGRIVQRGTPLELAAAHGGVYARLLAAAERSRPVAAGAAAPGDAPAGGAAAGAAAAAPPAAATSLREAIAAGAGMDDDDDDDDDEPDQQPDRSAEPRRADAVQSARTESDRLAEQHRRVPEDLAHEVTASLEASDSGSAEEEEAGQPARGGGAPRSGAQPVASGLTMPEESGVGRVSRRLYSVLLRAAGGRRMLSLVSLAFFAAEAASVATNWRLTHMSRARTPLGGLRAYCLLGALSALAVFFRQLLALGAGLRAGTVLHEQLIRRLLRAPVAFFDATPLGRLVNRLSKDQRTLDLQLPSTISQYAQTILVCASTCALICATAPAALLALALAAIAYSSLQGRYVKTSTGLRRLESAARSPVLSSVLEGVEGAPSIRAFGATASSTAAQRAMLDRLSRAVYALIGTNSWLGLRLEIVGSGVVAAAAVAATLLPNVLGADAGTAGLALASSLQLTQVLNWNVRTACELETQMISVERVHDLAVGAVEAPSFLAAPPAEAGGASRGAGADAAWPTAGALTVSNLTAHYHSAAEPVLRRVSFSVAPGQRLAVVGRTGSGKSTLLLCLLRLVEPSGGRIAIDGVDTSSLGLTRLRAALGVVPQEHTTFSGTLRDNLDPSGARSDTELRSALAAVRLGHLASSLDEPLGAGPGAPVKLSAGQRSLLAIARALLPPRRAVVLMDEPTASVDAETDALVQQLFATHFANKTTITVTHRLRTIEQADRVLVLDHGAVVEEGSPSELLASPDSALAGLLRSGTIERERV